MRYHLAQIVKMLIEPANLLCLLFLLGGIAAVLPYERVQRFGRRMCFALAVLLIIIAVIPVGHWALLPLENRYSFEKPDHVDGIVLLAGDEDPWLTQVHHQATLGSSARRIMYFASLAREYPGATLVYSGGHSVLASSYATTNGDVARLALKEVGIPSDRVVFEIKSRNTYENATFTAALVKPKPGQNWLLVTSASHMPRALMTFRKAGWTISPAPTDYRTAKEAKLYFDFHALRHLRELDTAIYEYSGFLTYWIAGRIERPWP
ncbi:MAG: YdcF family protein [Alphaproteobacteria bacterium]|nr:YdcF family protein [Alphaproteobacteria bacterium]